MEGPVRDEDDDESNHPDRGILLGMASLDAQAQNGAVAVRHRRHRPDEVFDDRQENLAA